MTKTVNVMHLVQGLEIGGLEIMVVNLLEELDRSRYRPAVCCFDSLGSLAASLSSGGVEVSLLKRRPGIDFRYVFRFASFLKKADTHILHLHNPTAFFYGTLAGKLAGVPCIVYTEHGRDFSSSNKVKVANRLLSRMVDKVITVADFGKKYLIENEGVDEAKIMTIHNGIDPKRFGAPYKRSEIRAGLGLEERHIIIGIVARLDPIKNHAGLISAMGSVIKQMPNAVLLIIGDGPMRAALETQVTASDLADHVRFLGARGDVPELMSILDLFVLCSHSEGLSLTLIEASAAAKPIVATDVGGNSEVVEDGINGLLVPADQPEPLATAILAILCDRVKARNMGEAGRQIFLGKFTSEAMVSKYETLYASCLERS